MATIIPAQAETQAFMIGGKKARKGAKSFELQMRTERHG
jgi:hypothetical protein